ncbi:M66 family metalloprotease [Vibrio sp.]|nr:M66 family metalloprotease [Vibrio sp.]
MNNAMKPLSFLISSLLLTGMSSQAYASSEKMYFYDEPWPNAIEGSLNGGVIYAQQSTIPAIKKVGDLHPKLTAQRDTLFLFQPNTVSSTGNYTLKVLNSAETVLTELTLSTPDGAPTLMGVSTEGPDSIQTPSTHQITISGRTNLDRINNEDNYFPSILNAYDTIEVKTADGAWVRDINLPSGEDYDNTKVTFESNAGYVSYIKHSHGQLAISRGDTITFKNVQGRWFHSGELELKNIQLAENVYSVTVPAEYMKPGVQFDVTDGEKTGRITTVPVGGFTEMFLPTIDIGIFEPPRDEFTFQYDEELHRQYFQSMPVSRLRVAHYEPYYLDKVVLDDGTTYTDYSSDTNTSVYNGDLETLSFNLISRGLMDANYGLNSSEGGRVNYQGSMLATKNTIARYGSGVQVHGLHTSFGVVSLDTSYANEFSHEMGHNFAVTGVLQHFPSGEIGTFHRPANDVNATWGWDSDTNEYVPNFGYVKTNTATCHDGVCIEPFHGYPYMTGAMSGAKNAHHGTGLNPSFGQTYTQYTVHEQNEAQRFLESKMHFEPESSTGFLKLNHDTGLMEEFENQQLRTDSVTVAPSGTTLTAMTELLSRNQSLLFDMTYFSWSADTYVPIASSDNLGKEIEFKQFVLNQSINLHINGQILITELNKTYRYRSNGQEWVTVDQINKQTLRTPIKKEGQIVTVLGYYDPRGILPTTIYPALEASFGYSYPSHAEGELVGCQLGVVDKQGQQRFYDLHNSRLNPEKMNRFHVNIPADEVPERVEVMCDDSLLDSRMLELKNRELPTSIIGWTEQDVTPTPDPLVSNAGANMTITELNQAVQLNANASTGDIDRFIWRINKVVGVSETSVLISDLNAVNPTVTFTEQPTDSAAYAVLRLQVRDADGNKDNDTIRLNVKLETQEELESFAGSNRTVTALNEPITLQGDQSTGPINKYIWRINKAVGLSLDSVVLSNKNAVNPTLTFTEGAIEEGAYINVRLQVRDDEGNKDNDVVRIFLDVQADPEPIPPANWIKGTPYQAGDQIQFEGNLFECAPAPYTAWCSGFTESGEDVSSFYAPGEYHSKIVWLPVP